MTATTVRPTRAPAPHPRNGPPTCMIPRIRRSGSCGSASPWHRSCSASTSSPTSRELGQYMAPEFTDLFHLQAHTLMYAVGAIEIVAGLVVAIRPRFGGYLVAAWLAGIIINLFLIADYYDVALRDFGLLLAALTLARLATIFPAGLPARRRV